MAGWNTNTWNTGSWGTGVDNIVSLTGISMSTGTGLVITDSTVEAGWGRDQWGARSWGNPSQIVVPTTPEDDMSMSLGSVSITAEINAGWGAKNWGDNSWGVAANLIAAGNSATATLGNETISIDVSPVPLGMGMTSALGNEAIDIATTIFQTGFAMTTTLANADAGPDAMATGNQATMGLGSVQAYNQTGWGRQEWNENAWGVEGQYANVDVTGISMTGAIGSLSLAGESVVTLNTLNVAQATLGVVDPAPDATITGNFMIGATGQLGMQGDVTQDVTGIAMSAGLGSVVAVPGQEVLLTGLPALARLSSPSYIIHVDVLVTGNSLTMAQGSGSALIWNNVNTGTAPITPPGWQEVAA